LYGENGEKEEKKNHILDDNIREINKFIKNNTLQEVCVSLDDRDIDQAAVYYAKKGNQEVTCSILEDGLAAYKDYSSNWTPHSYPLLHMIRQRVIHGFRYQRNISVYGDSNHISQIYATFPALLSSHYKEFIKSSVDPSPILELANSKEYTEYMEKSGINIKRLKDIEILFLCPKMDNLNKNSHKALLSDLIAELHSSGLNIGIKYHPRQQNAGDIFPEATTIPQSIPAELILIHAHTEVQAVVGGVSTVFLSSNWLLGGIEVVSIDYILTEAHTTETTGEEVSRALESLGVTFPKTIFELIKMIK
jgi:hypothetical protein